MKRFLLLMVVVCNYAFAKAQSNPSPQITPPQIGVKLGYGEMADLGDVQIKFKKLISDSRCPKDVTCVWAGEARVLVEIYENETLSREKELVFGATNQVLDIFTSEALGVNALRLMPYPDSQTKKDGKAYYMLLDVMQN